MGAEPSLSWGSRELQGGFHRNERLGAVLLFGARELLGGEPTALQACSSTCCPAKAGEEWQWEPYEWGLDDRAAVELCGVLCCWSLALLRPLVQGLTEVLAWV